MSRRIVLSILVLAASLALGGCRRQMPSLRTRAAAIPSMAAKVQPADDLYPPVLHAADWEEPIPLPGPINTAGAEDSPFVTPDGHTLYFFFTPDASIPPQQQLQDGVTGIWWSQRLEGEWSEPQRILLAQDLALDGCACASADVLWFCSARAGNLGEIDVYSARLRNGRWGNVTNAGALLNKVYDIGEFHFTPDGQALFFGATRKGGQGGLDLWWCEKTANGWDAPQNLGPAVNGPGDEFQPFLTADGRELWFTGTSRLGYAGPAVFRSLRGADGSWGEAEEVISQFAGEPTLDAAGNLYFVHHYIRDERILEADIYVTHRAPQRCSLLRP
ncbi:MAG: hypothetical protein ACUVX9_12720 [Anaerolineae bacterium]